MANRLVPAVLITLLVILHAQLWLGRGSVPNVAKLAEQVEAQKRHNAKAIAANERLNAEINDLKEGLEIIEEKARYDLGMVKANELYVQISK